MHNTLKKDLDGQENLLLKATAEGHSFLSSIRSVPTSLVNPQVSKQEWNTPGIGGEAALKEFKERFKNIMVASTGPRYWGFVTGGSTPAALMGDMLASIYDQNTQQIKGQGDISAIIEFETIGMLLDLFNLPKDFLGGFVTGATMSNFTCLGVARQWVGKQLGADIAREGVPHQLSILSAVPHSSSIKALAMLGLGSNSIQKIKTIDQTREAIDVSALEDKIRSLEGEPFVLISSGGTVNTVDYDDMKAISRLKEKYKFWWHIDAAFGGFAAVSPKHQHLLEGWENADSITIDGHKWLNVPYENAFFFVREKHRNLQIETFQNSNAPYLGDPMENFNYLNFLPENSRRLKALSAWFTLKAYGKAGYQEIVERNIHQAQLIGEYIEKSEYFELLAPVRLNTVCFTLKGGSNQERVDKWLSIFNDGGKVFMTPTTFNGKKGIRAALVNWRTTEEDVILAMQEMEKALNKTFSKYATSKP